MDKHPLYIFKVGGDSLKPITVEVAQDGDYLNLKLGVYIQYLVLIFKTRHYSEWTISCLCFFSLVHRYICMVFFSYYSSGHKIFEANLTSTCNQNCACSPNHIQPICGINEITYFSPCHAGCTGSNYFYDPGKEEKSFVSPSFILI